MENFSNKVAVIIGGTSGIGEACAINFAKKGIEVVVAGRNEERGKSVINLIKNNNGEGCFKYLDVTSDESIDKFQHYIGITYGKIDILYNNSGIYPVSPPLEDIDRNSLNKIFDVNIFGMIMITKALLPYVKKSKGSIINNASIGGLESFTSGQSYAYTASKSAVIKFSKMLAKKYGIFFRTNCICPGTINTPIFKNFDEDRMAKNIPMGRTGTPEEVASLVYFLSSKEASYINGAVITIDGGQSL